jgi:hypothetical protein
MGGEEGYGKGGKWEGTREEHRSGMEKGNEGATDVVSRVPPRSLLAGYGPGARPILKTNARL